MRGTNRSPHTTPGDFQPICGQLSLVGFAHAAGSTPNPPRMHPNRNRHRVKDYQSMNQTRLHLLSHQ
uniref:Uncharacterized protein n=1 Tax=Triticum urartu TaxID=4572 RepID=A0A8R7QCD1_TRIUA